MEMSQQQEQMNAHLVVCEDCESAATIRSMCIAGQMLQEWGYRLDEQQANINMK